MRYLPNLHKPLCLDTNVSSLTQYMNAVSLRPPVVIPDLFRGVPWTEGRSMSEYEEWRSQHDMVRVRSDAACAADFLKDRGCGERFAMVGFCFGGGRLMEEIAKSANGLNPKAAIAFYPTRKYIYSFRVCAKICDKF